MALTEEDFLERFEKSDPRFEEIDARTEAAQAEVAAASVLPNPAFAFDREEVFPAGGSLPENYLRLELPIAISGRRARRVAAAEAGARAAKAEAERNRWMLRLDGLDLYHDAALARLRFETLRGLRRPLAAIVEAMAARARAGDASEYDRRRLDVELAEHDDLLADAQTRLSTARHTLAALIGDPVGRYEASDSLAIPVSPRALDAEVDSALAARADYRAAGGRLRQAENELSAARRAWIPNLTLSAGWKSVDTGAQVADGYLAGLGLTIPLFDRGEADRAAALAERHAAESRRRFLAVRIPLAIESARSALAHATERARSYEQTQLPKLDRLVRSAEAAHGAGERSAFELVDAYRTAREVRLHALDLRREAKRSETDLWRALGRRP